MGEYGHFEFRWETFGTLNHPSFGYPSSTIGTAAMASLIPLPAAIASCNSAGVYEF
jgi:hypothetical protein